MSDILGSVIGSIAGGVGNSIGSALFGGGGEGSQTQSTGSSQWSSTTPGFLDELQKVLSGTLNGTTGFSKTDAIGDVRGVIRSQALDALQSVMPKIAGSITPAGAYDSTTKTLLQNDANARVTNQLSTTILNAILGYNQASNQRISAFSDAARAGTSSVSQGSSSGSANRVGKDSNSLVGNLVTGGVASLFDSNGGVDNNTTDMSSYGSNPINSAGFGSWGMGSGNSSGGFSGFADGGQVGKNILQRLFPNNIFERNRAALDTAIEQQSGGQPASGQIVINVGTGGGENSQSLMAGGKIKPPQGPEQDPQTKESFSDMLFKAIMDRISGGQGN